MSGRDRIARKVMEIIAEAEEDIVSNLSQKLREKLNRKPNWTRTEVLDEFTECITEVRNERRKGVSD